MKDILTTDEDL